MYTLLIKPKLDKVFSKLRKRNLKQFQIIQKKVEEILENPQHYKNLHAPLQHWKRVHIDGSFVLAFSVDEATNTLTLEDYAHHDDIY